nr:F-box protein PP2-B10-like [Ziziphus jujuba var. spinosa]
MIGARTLSIAWGDTPDYWRWTSLPAESSFSKVAELRLVWWLDIKGRIETNILSPKSTYGAYFVYKLNEHSWGFEGKPVGFRVYFEGEEELHEDGGGRKVFLDPSKYDQEPCQIREDGWLEVEMGEFFNDGGEDHQVVVCSLLETVMCKSGLIVEGIEFRPKFGRQKYI